MAVMITNVYIPIKWLDQRVDRQDLVWIRFSDGRREGICVVPRYQATCFMFIGNCFVVTVFSHNFTITWVVIKKKKSKSGTFVMGNICTVCYSFQDVLSDAEIQRRHNIGGNNPLLICRDSFNSNIKIPTSGGPSNSQKN